MRESHRLYLAKPRSTAGFISLEGFIAAKSMGEGLKRAGAKLTRPGCIKAAESMKTDDLGGFTLHFSPDDPAGSDYTDLTVISRGGSFMY